MARLEVRADKQPVEGNGETEVVKKRGRGRPKGKKNPSTNDAEDSASASKKKRQRSQGKSNKDDNPEGQSEKKKQKQKKTDEEKKMDKLRRDKESKENLKGFEDLFAGQVGKSEFMFNEVTLKKLIKRNVNEYKNENDVGDDKLSCVSSSVLDYVRARANKSIDDILKLSSSITETRKVVTAKQEDLGTIIRVIKQTDGNIIANDPVLKQIIESR